MMPANIYGQMLYGFLYDEVYLVAAIIGMT